MHNLRLLWLLSAVLLLSTVTTAWPWPDLDTIIVRRQDKPADSPSPSPTDKPSSPSPSPSDSAKPTDSAAASSTNTDSSATDKPTGSSKPTGSDASSKTSSPKSTVVDPRLPAGGVNMVTPGPLIGAQYYRVGNNITFGWNYTSLSVSPSAVDILATNTAQPGVTHTIARNQSVERTNSVIWDTNKYPKTAKVNLVTEKYTLIIHDAAKDVSATAQAGYLSTFNQFTFGVYNPQPYEDLNEFQCATCVKSGALRVVAPLLVALLGGVGGFGWFVGMALW